MQIHRSVSQFVLLYLIIMSCTEVTCELKSTTYGVRRINPEGKTIFKAGESVEITCTEKHWFYGTKENIQSFTCGENGQWDHEPVCAGKIIEKHFCIYC